MTEDASCELRGRVTVVSPHLDDAILALGATIARATTAGAHVTVVTPLAGDPASEAPAGWWDRSCGFRSEGEAARLRRDEDREACSVVGARPVWLEFKDVQYGERPEAGQFWKALQPHLEGDVVLLPGFPLEHPDHAWLTGLVLDRLVREPRAGFYLELPYASPRHLSRRPGILQERLGRALAWHRLSARRVERRVKGRACRSYGSQFGLLRPHLPAHLAVPELWATRECLAWLD